MSFSAKRCAYCPRPSFSSQSGTCCIEAAPRIVRLHRPRWQLYPRSSKRSRQHIPREWPHLDTARWRTGPSFPSFARPLPSRPARAAHASEPAAGNRGGSSTRSSTANVQGAEPTGWSLLANSPQSSRPRSSTPAARNHFREDAADLGRPAALLRRSERHIHADTQQRETESFCEVQ
jgi:hypothetical protein